MKVFLNSTRVRRQHNLGRALVLLGLGLLAAGFVYSLVDPEAASAVLLVALPGALLAHFGIPRLQKWGADRRIDHALDDALKGLDDRWTLLHYLPGVDHVLAGPPGMLVLLPRGEEGRIEYEQESAKWVHETARSGLLRRGGRKHISGLADQAAKSSQRLRDLLASPAVARNQAAPAQPVLLFLSDKADVAVDPDQTPLPAVHYKKVKDWLRRLPRGDAPPEEVIAALIAQHGLVPRRRDS